MRSCEPCAYFVRLGVVDRWYTNLSVCSGSFWHYYLVTPRASLISIIIQTKKIPHTSAHIKWPWGVAYMTDWWFQENCIHFIAPPVETVTWNRLKWWNQICHFFYFSFTMTLVRALPIKIIHFNVSAVHQQPVARCSEWEDLPHHQPSDWGSHLSGGRGWCGKRHTDCVKTFISVPVKGELWLEQENNI